jgi:alpha-galactosidase
VNDSAASDVRDRLVHLRADGVSVLVRCATDRLPAVVHWGEDLGPLDADGAAAAAMVVRAEDAYENGVDAGRPALVPETWSGWFGRPGLVASRGGRAWSTRFRTASVTVDGADVDGFVEHGTGLLVVAAGDEENALHLELEVELLVGGLVRTRARLRNDGEPLALHELSLYLPVPDGAEELLDLTGRWGMERVAQRHPFVVGSHLREGRRGRTGLDSPFVLHATEPGAGFERGRTWAVHVGWSGNTRYVAEHHASGDRLLGGGELLLPDEVHLAAGEGYTTPWLHGAYGDGLDAVAHRFHDHLRSRPQHVDAHRPVTLNVWEAVYFDHDTDRLLELARVASEIGIERFVLDDGWFGARRHDRAGLGDWTVSPEAWPDGLHPLVDAVHAHGMQFGLWFEPEMVNLDSDLARAHPEWVMAARAELPVEQRHQHVLNLADPGCYDAVLGQLLAVLDEYDVQYVKWDHNRDHVEAGHRSRGGRPVEHEQTLAIYRMLAAVKAAHPGLEIESCSAGGGRIDLGVLELTDRVWVSDCIDPLERQRLMRWTAQLLPPELMGSHVGSPRSHTTGRRHDLSFRAATALFGHYGVEWDVTSATDEERSELAAWIAVWKQHRELLATGRLVRGPDPSATTWVHGVVAADRSQALVEVASLAWNVPERPPRARLRGLDPDRAYRVTPVQPGAAPSGLRTPPWWSVEGTVVPGAVLERVGLQVPAVHPEQSVVLHLEAVDPPP